MNTAVAVVSLVIVILHVDDPLHPPPLHPANVDPEAGMAVSVTEVPVAKPAEQAAPQLIPVGVLVTVPFPDPPVTTVRVTSG